MNPRRWLSFRGLLAVLAVVAIGIGAVAAFRAPLLPTAVRQAIAGFPVLDERATMALAVGGVLLSYALVTKWMKVEPDRSDWLSDYRREEPERQAAVAGQTLMDAFDARVRGDPQSPEPVRARLRDLLIAVHAREVGSLEAAEAHVDAGRWTTDRYAGAFLSATGEVDFPWYHRLYAWLYPGRAYEHRVDRTLTAVERVCDERLVSYARPADREGDRPSLGDRVRSRLGLETTRS